MCYLLKWQIPSQLIVLIVLKVITLSLASSYQHEPCDDVYNETCIDGNEMASLHKFSIIKCLQSESFLQNITQSCEYFANNSLESIAVDTLHAFNSWMCNNHVSFIDICQHTFNCKIKLTDTFYSTLRLCSRKIKQQETFHLVCGQNITHAVQRESSMFHCLKFTLESYESNNSTCANWRQQLNLDKSLNKHNDSHKFIEWFCKNTDARDILHKIEFNCINNDKLSLVYGDCLRI